ncbi:Peptidase M3 [Gracilaria domingensis]|nr:Peptidase M3 [Gracilaria domingensis]
MLVHRIARQSQLRYKHAASFFSRSRRAHEEDKPGYFGLKGLHRPSDWQHLGNQCIDDCLQLAESIRSQRANPSVAVLQTFDDLSDRLCEVLDVAELCRNVHPEPEFVEAANAAFLNVSSVIQHLNADKSLYDPLNKLYESHVAQNRDGSRKGANLTGEDLIMVKSLKQDFERGGINLSYSEKMKLIQLQDEVTTASAKFMSAPLERPTTIQLPYHKLSSVPGYFLKSLKRAPENPDHVLIPLHGSSMQFLLKWVPDSKVREKVYRLSHNGQRETKDQYLATILGNRLEIANILGHDSYAGLLFADRLASSPSEVLEFLEALSSLIRRPALDDRTAIEMEKLRREPHLASNGSMKIHGWDRSFYIGRLKAENFDISSAQIAQYFPLSACMYGLGYLLHATFGVHMVRCHANEGELWHEDVQKLQLKDSQGEVLGQIFLDLYPREGKYGHAAHFSVTCGRQPPNGADYQIPTVALVCNFGRDDHSGERLLTISEYETFFHEFGHSLHSIFSRTKYQHLSGTRVTTDFVEIPSHVFEHFAWHPLLISKFAHHHQTGDPMPTKLVRSLCASRNGFISTDTQMQLLFSAMDLQFHGPDPPIWSTTEAFEELQSRLTVYEPDEDVAVPTSFHHFVGYGAGYYTYVFARVLSAQLWNQLFGSSPFSREGGANLRHGLLAYGGAQDPAALLRNVVNGEINCEAFLANLGISEREAHAKLRIPIRSAKSS